MPVRFASLLALAAVVILPTRGGGSDFVRASQAAPTTQEAPTTSVAPGGALESPSGPTAAPWVDPSPGHGPKTRFQPSSSPRELLLSFDDGPDLKGTPLILDELDRRGLKAIFFVNGWRSIGQRPEDVARRDLLRKIASHGHLVANHTFRHHNLCENPGEQAMQIDSNAEVIAQATGVRPLLFRSPYGARCHSLETTLAARQLVDVGWNLDPQDWKNNTPELILKYMTDRLGRLQGRGILLLHDTHAASVHALPQLLDWIARDNRRAVSAGQPPVKIIDYRALLPPRPMAESGLELIVRRFADDLAPSMQRLGRLLPLAREL